MLGEDVNNMLMLMPCLAVIQHNVWSWERGIFIALCLWIQEGNSGEGSSIFTVGHWLESQLGQGLSLCLCGSPQKHGNPNRSKLVPKSQGCPLLLTNTHNGTGHVQSFNIDS